MNLTMMAYSYYKSKHDNYLFLFRHKDGYRAYYNDAKRISSLLNYSYDDISNSVFISSNINIYDIVGELYNYGIVCKLIMYRNENGEFDLPGDDVFSYEKEDW